MPWGQNHQKIKTESSDALGEHRPFRDSRNRELDVEGIFAHSLMAKAIRNTPAKAFVISFHDSSVSMYRYANQAFEIDIFAAQNRVFAPWAQSFEYDQNCYLLESVMLPKNIESKNAVDSIVETASRIPWSSRTRTGTMVSFWLSTCRLILRT